MQLKRHGRCGAVPRCGNCLQKAERKNRRRPNQTGTVYKIPENRTMPWVPEERHLYLILRDMGRHDGGAESRIPEIAQLRCTTCPYRESGQSGQKGSTAGPFKKAIEKNRMEAARRHIRPQDAQRAQRAQRTSSGSLCCAGRERAFPLTSEENQEADTAGRSNFRRLVLIWMSRRLPEERKRMPIETALCPYTANYLESVRYFYKKTSGKL